MVTNQSSMTGPKTAPTRLVPRRWNVNRATRRTEVAGITLFGPRDLDRRGGVVPFTIEGMHPHDIAELCDREAVCVRAGHHCAQPLMRVLGVGATARASFHVYNTRDDVDRLVHALNGAREVFGL